MYVGELYFTYSGENEPQVTYPSTHDRRTLRTVVSDLRSSGEPHAVPIVYPAFLSIRPDFYAGKKIEVGGQEILPLGGISSRTTVLCNEGGYWATYRSDERGFRNPSGTWAGEIDIAVVGDSFSHGNCVNDGEDWVSMVRAKYPRILNLGMGGNGALFELAELKEYLTSIRPKIVIWEYFEANDTRIPAEEVVPMLKRYLNEPSFQQGLAGKQSGIDAVLENIVEHALDGWSAGQTAPTKFRVVDFLILSKVRQRLGIRAGGSGNPSLVTLSRVLAEGQRVVSQWGGKLYFVYLPSALGLTSKEAPSWYASRAAVLGVAKEAGLAVVDVYPPMATHPDPPSLFPYRGNFHYNAAGYRIVANTVLNSLNGNPALTRAGGDSSKPSDLPAEASSSKTIKTGSPGTPD